MKKKVAGAMLLLMLGVGAVSSTAYAKNPLWSPEGVTITPPTIAYQNPAFDYNDVRILENIQNLQKNQCRNFS